MWSDEMIIAFFREKVHSFCADHAFSFPQRPCKPLPRKHIRCKFRPAGIWKQSTGLFHPMGSNRELFTKQKNAGATDSCVWSEWLDSSTLWSKHRLAGVWQKSTGLLHLMGSNRELFTKQKNAGATDSCVWSEWLDSSTLWSKHRLAGVWQKSTGLLHLMGSNHFSAAVR